MAHSQPISKERTKVQLNVLTRDLPNLCPGSIMEFRRCASCWVHGPAESEAE